MSQVSFHLVYDGPALQRHEMEVRDLAPALLALGEVVEEANRALNADRAQVAVRVKASFKSGSFGIDLQVTQNLLGQARDLFAGQSVTAAVNLLALLGFVVGPTLGSGLLGFLRWLRNRTIRNVVLLDNGRVKVVLDDDSLEIERAVIDLYRQYRLRKALEEVIAKPLEREGIDYFAVKATGKEQPFVEVRKDERNWFVAPPQEDELIQDKEEETNLQLVNISFREENKWRFSDGASPFYAAILDDHFLNRVQTNEAVFSKGDILKVRLRKRQWLAGEEMKTDYEVLEVLEHRRAGTQLRLPMTPGTG